MLPIVLIINDMSYFLFYSATYATNFKLTTKLYGSEISWKFGDTCTSDLAYDNNQEYSKTCNLSPGLYTLECLDSYGDGWHGGYIEILGTKYCESFTSGRSKNVAVTIPGIHVTLNHT